MNCVTPYAKERREEALQAQRKARAEKGYHTRKVLKAKVFQTARSILQCGPYEDRDLAVRGGQNWVEIEWLGQVVYKNISWNIVIARYHECWVEALRCVESRLKTQRFAYATRTLTIEQQAAAEDARYGF
jgi:hypothetical protein